MLYQELRNEQIRQLIDAEQVFEAWREADRERRRRFLGSMSWKTLSGRDYLYRKVSGSAKSLGPRSPETEELKTAFEAGRERNAAMVRGLIKRIGEMAPVNRALRLGRLPRIAARILRKLDASGLLGRNVRVTGTNALFAYERAATDLKLLLTQDIRREQVVGLLKSVDTSFKPMGSKNLRAVNADGFMVNLITAPEKSRLQSRPSLIGYPRPTAT